MMKWQIPAKTFLIGEYVALLGSSAIVLTTKPYFTLTLTSTPGLQGIHANAPAGRLWYEQDFSHYGLIWHDPYYGQGGLGASSGQFLAVYRAIHHLKQEEEITSKLLATYYKYAWQGVGLRPSGYDILAQMSQEGCVFINLHNNMLISQPWPFEDIGFIILHSGQKLPTHTYLQTTTLPDGIPILCAIVEQAQQAFQHNDSTLFIQAIQAYQEQLTVMNLMDRHTIQQIKNIQSNNHTILAAKGCGAMGADTILIIVPKESLDIEVAQLKVEGWPVMLHA